MRNGNLNGALVVHPTGFSVLGGGELVCLHTVRALQSLGYQVTLATDRFEPDEVEEHYGNGLGIAMSRCNHVQVEGFRPRIRFLVALQRLEHARKTRDRLERETQKVVFYTQSALYLPLGNRRIFQFVYDIEDLQVPELCAQQSNYPRLYHLLLKYYRKLFVKPEPDRTFIALSSNILETLKVAGYTNAHLVLPPVAPVIGPGEKLRQVVQVTRVVPQKRLKIFVETARRLPEYEFYLVSKTDPQYAEYKKRLFLESPANLHFIEKPVREVSDILSRSRVYFYTSQEPGVNIATIEGVLAGCYPVCPSKGGGAEIVREIGIGSTFATIDEAVVSVKSGMEGSYSPTEISEMGNRFSPQSFEEQVKRIVGGQLLG